MRATVSAGRHRGLPMPRDWCALRASYADGPLSAVRGSMQVALQLGFDGARILTLRDAQHAVDDHFAELSLPRNDDLQFGGNRQKEEIGEPDAVNRRGERRGDPVAELARVGEILQHGHQPENRADDAESGRVDAHALKYPGG